MRSEAWDNVERKLRCLRAVTRAELDDARRFELANIVDTYIRLDSEEEVRFESLIGQDANKEVQKMVITWEDALAASRAPEARGTPIGRLVTRTRGDDAWENDLSNFARKSDV